jgi:cation diffusion facilitator CzcD-associated flavoprotein CzcO
LNLDFESIHVVAAALQLPMTCGRHRMIPDLLPPLTEPIAAIRPGGVLTADGVEHAVDTLILGTGFNVSEQPIAERIRGRAGRSLAETWEGSPKAHLGTTVAGFPNLFMMLGPTPRSATLRPSS